MSIPGRRAIRAGFGAAWGALAVVTAVVAALSCNGSVQACAAGYATCSAAASCETNLQSDPNNCGVCGRSCSGGACSFGTCGAVGVCPSGESECNGVCVPAGEPCAVSTCPSGESECNGVCQPADEPCAITTCPSGFSQCNGGCVPPDQLCCPVGESACNGVCQPSGLGCVIAVCGPGEVMCNGSCQPEQDPCCGDGESTCNGVCLPSGEPCIACPSGETACGDTCCPPGSPCSDGECLPSIVDAGGPESACSALADQWCPNLPPGDCFAMCKTIAGEGIESSCEAELSTLENGGCDTTFDAGPPPMDAGRPFVDGCFMPPPDGLTCTPGEISCGTATCKVPGEQCCQTNGPLADECQPVGAACASTVITCNEASDCTGGQICCLAAQNTSTGVVSCQTPVGGKCPTALVATTQVCRSSNECLSGSCHFWSCVGNVIESCTVPTPAAPSLCTEM